MNGMHREKMAKEAKKDLPGEEEQSTSVLGADRKSRAKRARRVDDYKRARSYSMTEMRRQLHTSRVSNLFQNRVFARSVRSPLFVDLISWGLVGD